jgi:hypothetical protein
MRNLHRLLFPTLIAGALSAACTAGYSGYTTTGTATVYTATPRVAPPPPRVVYRDHRPGYVYVQGRWVWDGYQWTWVEGRWLRQRAGYVYDQGYWDRRGDTYVWVSGRWTPRGNTRYRVEYD